MRQFLLVAFATLAIVLAGPIVNGAMALSPPAVAGNQCPTGTVGVHLDVDVVDCMVIDSAHAAEVNCEATTPGSVLVIRRDNGEEACALGDTMTALDGSPIENPAFSSETAADVDEPEVMQNPATADILRSGTSSCPEGYTLGENPKNPGVEVCVGETKLVCDKELSRKEVPVGAFNILWLKDQCVYSYEMMN